MIGQIVKLNLSLMYRRFLELKNHLYHCYFCFKDAKTNKINKTLKYPNWKYKTCSSEELPQSLFTTLLIIKKARDIYLSDHTAKSCVDSCSDYKEPFLYVITCLYVEESCNNSLESLLEQLEKWHKLISGREIVNDLICDHLTPLTITLIRRITRRIVKSKTQS